MSVRRTQGVPISPAARASAGAVVIVLTTSVLNRHTVGLIERVDVAEMFAGANAIGKAALYADMGLTLT